MFKLHYRLERNSLGLLLGILLVSAIGGLVEIAPLFTIDETVEKDPDMRVYTPLELAGRHIYMREGCYACHSQMVRALRDEVERYGPYSLAVESQYDRPMLWGSKRTGPDLARVGGKYSDDWHLAHFLDPRAVMPSSVMPAYAWLMRNELRVDDLELHLQALHRLGTPYTEAMIENAALDAWAQSAPDSDASFEVFERYGEETGVRAFDGDARHTAHAVRFGHRQRDERGLRRWLRPVPPQRNVVCLKCVRIPRHRWCECRVNGALQVRHAAKARRQMDDSCSAPDQLLAHVPIDSDVGPPEAIDRLLGIPHDEELARQRLNLSPGALGRVGSCQQ